MNLIKKVNRKALFTVIGSAILCTLSYAAVKSQALVNLPSSKQIEELTNYNEEGFPIKSNKTYGKRMLKYQGDASLLQKAEESTESYFNSTNNFRSLTNRKKEVSVSTFDMPVIYASVINDNVDLTKRSKYTFTMYKLPVIDNGELTMMTKNIRALHGGLRIDDIYYLITYTGAIYSPTYVIKKYDFNTWELIETITMSDNSLYADCLTYDPTTGAVYGCFGDDNSDTPYCIGLADLKNSSPYKVKLRDCSSFEDRWDACAVTTDGKLYAINKKGELLQVNKTTGVGTVIGNTGLSPYYAGGGCIDPETNKFYYTPYTAEKKTAMYEVDLTTGAAHKVLTLPEDVQFMGLAPANSIPNAKVPAAVSNQTANFENGSLSGQISFTTPTTTFDGKNATGELEYTIYEGENILATGNTTYGADVVANVSVSEAAIHSFVIVTKNTIGTSPRSWLKLYVGYDIPKQPQNATVTYNNETGDVNITWDAVTEGTQGSYLLSDEIFYRVTDLYDNTVVADNLSTTSFKTNLANAEKLKNHQYSIEAVFRGMYSEPTLSNPAVPGSLELPYLNTFNDGVDNPDGYYILNVNGDKNTWRNFSSWFGVFKSTDGSKMDDWLFSPPVLLEAGKTYQVSADMGNRALKCPERIAVYWGENNTIDAMTNVGLEEFELNHASEGYRNYFFLLTPEKTGYYYIGFHGVSEPEMGWLSIDNFAISEPTAMGTPSQVKYLTVSAGANGAHRATIEFNAPDTDISGNTLSSLTKIEIYRNNELIKTFENPNVGEYLSYLDINSWGGTKEYVIIPYNENGKGLTNRKSVFLGSYIPNECQDVSIHETENDGEVELSWIPPVYDLLGAKLTQEELRYNIYQYDYNTNGWVKRLSNIEGTTTARYQACSPDVQEYAYFAVSAVTACGEGDIYCSEMIPVGAPWPAPFMFSFTTEDMTKHPLIIEYLADDVWRLCNDNTISGVTAADNDNAFIGFRATYANDQASMATGKIAIPEGASPLLKFQVFKYNATGVNNNNTLEISIKDHQDWKVYRTITVKDLLDYGWNTVTIPMSEYAGKDVQIRFICTCVDHLYFFMDDLQVLSNGNEDLGIMSLDTPETVRMNNTFNADVVVQNNGPINESNYKVQISVDGKVRSEVNGVEVAPGEYITISIPTTLLPIDNETSTLKAKVILENDQVESNNESTDVSIKMGLPRFNTPTNLEGEDKPNGELHLSWTAPALEGNIPEPTFEDFETYTSWQGKNVGKWTIIDRDGGGIGGISNFSFPNIHKGDVLSFWVLDSSLADIASNNSFTPHGGVKYLAQMYSADLSQSTFTPVTCDDWAITPELFGCEQTISLYARSYSPSNPETFQVLYSTGSTNPDDFILLATEADIPYIWQKYEYTVPEGAKYFAVRCISYNEFMFFFDEVTFIEANDTPFELLGYNLWVNGEKVNNEPIKETSITRESITGTYFVTAVWNHGESLASNKIDIVSGVDSAVTDNISVKGTVAAIEIDSDSTIAVKIWSADGRKIASFENNGLSKTPVLPGVYVVRANNKNYKVIVK